MFSGYDETKEEVPEHLAELREMFRKGSSYVYDVDDAAYASVAFKLMEVANGDKDALKDVVKYIQKQHIDLKLERAKRETFMKEIVSWLYWAKAWTIRKPSV
jgi:hypothetical protein